MTSRVVTLPCPGGSCGAPLAVRWQESAIVPGGWRWVAPHHCAACGHYLTPVEQDALAARAAAVA